MTAPIISGEIAKRFLKPLIMGVVNCTPDSFHAESRATTNDLAVERALKLVEEGADILDIGGESTRPGSDSVAVEIERLRVIPVIRALSRQVKVKISIDTTKAAIAAEALDCGATIINDVSALRHDPRSLEFAARSGAPVVLMHAPGEGDDLHGSAAYTDVVLDVFDWLAERREAALTAGIAREKIVLDPGIGFGKEVADNLALLNALSLFHALGQPLLVGASRKRMIGALDNEAPPHKRLGGSVALAVKAMDAGVQLVRVHDVAETVQAVRVWRGLRDAALTDFKQLPA